MTDSGGAQNGARAASPEGASVLRLATNPSSDPVGTDGSMMDAPLLADLVADGGAAPVAGPIDIAKEIQDTVTALSAKWKAAVYPLFIPNDADINHSIVSDVFDDLRDKLAPPKDPLYVVVNSGGGDIHAAYHLAQLFRQYAKGGKVTFVIPRWAKSAATLLACGGVNVLMSPIAELGPVDPQIEEFNGLDRRLEKYSPLQMEATMELIRKEFREGEERLAKGLLQRLQFPLTLGGIKRSSDIAVVYIVRLLKTGMFAGEADAEATSLRIAKRLVESYEDHGFCIESREALELGLKIEVLKGEELDLAWKLYRLYEKKEMEDIKRSQQFYGDLLKNLPPGFRDALPVPGLNPERRVEASVSQSTRMKTWCHEMSDRASEVALSIASELLRRRGEVSLNELRSIPFLRHSEDVDEIIALLVRDFDVELITRKQEGQSILGWERVLRLKGGTVYSSPNGRSQLFEQGRFFAPELSSLL